MLQGCIVCIRNRFVLLAICCNILIRHIQYGSVMALKVKFPHQFLKHRFDSAEMDQIEFYCQIWFTQESCPKIINHQTFCIHQTKIGDSIETNATEGLVLLTLSRSTGRIDIYTSNPFPFFLGLYSFSFNSFIFRSEMEITNQAHHIIPKVNSHSLSQRPPT